LGASGRLSGVSAHVAEPLGTPSENEPLVDAASRVYEAELDAMRAFAREDCGECPSESPKFLAGARYAFERAVALHPNDPRALMGLANVLFSTGFLDAGEPIDSVLANAEVLATRAAKASASDSLRTAAESLAARIRRSR
jgi:hypothetical protein